MQYEIIKQYEDKTVNTVVKFDFLDDEITISHFNPSSDRDIQKGIENRYISEKRKFDEGILSDNASE